MSPRSLEEESGARATSFGESDAHFADLVPVHDRDGPDGVVPLHLVADDGRAADFLGDEAAQWHIRVDAFQLQAVQGGDRAQLGVAFEDEVAEEALVAAATGLESESTDGVPNAGFAFDADSIRGQVAVWAARLDPDGAAPNDDIYEARSSIGFGRLHKGLYPLRGGVTPELRGIMDGITNTYLSAHTETPGNGGLMPDAHLADPDGIGPTDGVTADSLEDPSLGTAPGTGPAFPTAAEQAADAERQARVDAGEFPEGEIPFDDRTTNEKRADIFRAVFDHTARDPQTPTSVNR